MHQGNEQCSFPTVKHNPYMMKCKQMLFVFLLLAFGKTFAQTAAVPGGLKTLVEESFQKYPRLESMNQLVELSQTQVDLSKAGYMPIASGMLLTEDYIPLLW